MARPLSEEKRNALLAAAAQAVYRHGVGAPTALIAKDAGVAEGTLFTYFASKDELLNQLYLQLKSRVAGAMMKGYPSDERPLELTRHVWLAYIRWARKHPAERQAIKQLGASVLLSDATRRHALEPLAEVELLIEECTGTGLEKMPGFATAIMGALVEATIDQIACHPEQAGGYAEAGFQAFWRAVADP